MTANLTKDTIIPSAKATSLIISSHFSGLPDEKGRIQILNIHTAKMRQYDLLASDVDIKELAVETKNYSGAELEGLVRAAQSTAMNRHIKVRVVLLIAFILHVCPCPFTLCGWRRGVL